MGIRFIPPTRSRTAISSTTNQDSTVPDFFSRRLRLSNPTRVAGAAARSRSFWGFFFCLWGDFFFLAPHHQPYWGFYQQKIRCPPPKTFPSASHPERALSSSL